MVYDTLASSADLMTTPPSPAFTTLPSQARPQSWFERNWKWFVPLLIVFGVLVLALLVGGLFWSLESMMRSSYAYQLAVERAMESPAVAARLGKPLHIGWLVSGNVNFSGAEENAKLSIPISGPYGKGDIIVVGKKRANHWSFETLEVDVSGQDEPIPLLEPPLDTSPASTGNST
jgi:cytochrome oxidase complex assembly protein 1